jgi:hypothetical protein
MGVPKALDPWVNSFYEIILDYVNEQIKSDWTYEGEMTYQNPKTGEVEKGTAKRSDEITVPGNEVMHLMIEKNGFSDLNDFIKSDIFTSLPLWRPEISFTITGIPDQVYENEKENPISARIGADLDKSLSTFGKIKVLSKLDFQFDIVVSLDGPSNKFSSELKSSIAHELLHGYQKYKQLEKGKAGHYGKETALNSLTQIPLLSEVEIDSWKKFMYLVYLHLSFEINARITELYHKLNEKGVNTKEEFLKEIKKSHIWSQMKNLEEFEAKKFIESFSLPSTEIDMSSGNPLEILSNALKGRFELQMLQQRGIDVSSKEEALKSLVSIWDMLLQAGNEQIKRETGIDFNMLPVPQNAKKDPYLFFKFFEDRFHKNAEKWKRKIYRLGSLLIK